MIRGACADDFDQVLDLGRRMHAEGWFSHLPLDCEKVRAMFEALLADPARGLVLVSERNGAIDGFFAAVISEPWYSRARVAQDVALFVAPDRRGGLIAANFVTSFLEWADAQGAAEKTISVSSGVRPDDAGRLLNRFGLTRVGGVFKQKGAACVTA